MEFGIYLTPVFQVHIAVPHTFLIALPITQLNSVDLVGVVQIVPIST
jgi:hypothetical protein